MSQKEVDAWKKRFRSKKGTLYFLRCEPIAAEWKLKRYPDAKQYLVAWRETHKQGHLVARLGWLEDGMSCRYGIQTYCTLEGPTPFDFQYGTCNEDDFEILRKVYLNETKNLATFDLDMLKYLEH